MRSLNKGSSFYRYAIITRPLMRYLEIKRIKGGDKNDIILDFTMYISDSYGDYCGGDKRNRGNRSCIIW